MSDLMMIVLQDLFNTLCLYDIRLGGTKLLYEDLNKIFLLLFVAAFVTIKHRHYVHPQLLPYILILIVALYLCTGDLDLQLPPLWLKCPCVQKYVYKYAGIGWQGCPWQGMVEGVEVMLVFFLKFSPYLAEISCISYWLWKRTCCIISAAPVAIGGAGSSGGALFTIFDWCWNSAERRIMMSSTISSFPYPYYLMFKKVFDLVEDVVSWSDGVTMHISHFFFDMIQITWWYIYVRWEEVRKNLTYVSHKFSGSTILYEDNILIVDGCEKLLDQCLFDYTHFVEN